MNKAPEKTLTEASQSEVVTLAVYLLGGDQRAIDTEDIAVKAHTLAPGRFSWRKYPDQINLELIRVYLSDAKKRDKGEMLIGSGKTGWRLSQNGLKWAQRAAASMGSATAGRSRQQSRSGSIDEQRWRRERSRLRSTSAWQKWFSGDREITRLEANQVFRIDSYAKGDLREAKITRVSALFNEDDELKPFIDFVVQRLAMGE